MRVHSLVVIVVGLLAAAPSVHAQSELAGSWTLAGPSESGGRGGGVPGFPLATQLDITVRPSEVVVESDTGSARSIQQFVYKLDGTVTKVPGPLGWETTAQAAWKDDTLVVTITRTIDGPNGPVGVNVSDVYRVEGAVLTIERSLGRNRQTLVYNRKS